jgi:hypothetical protein
VDIVALLGQQVGPQVEEGGNVGDDRDAPGHARLLVAALIPSHPVVIFVARDDRLIALGEGAAAGGTDGLTLRENAMRGNRIDRG